ncbi:MAG TPA: hypothetical protein VGG16_05240 [Streptosporangiaceae bacterium]
MHVWIHNWTPAGKVTVSLFTVTEGQQAAFTSSSCHKHSSCTIPAPGKSPAALHAQVTAKHTAKSITVKAVGAASAGKLAKPLAVSDSVQLILPASTTTSPSAPAPGVVGIEPGAIPTLNDITSSKLMSPGSAAGLFPTIAPSAAPSAPVTRANPAKTRADQSVQVLPLGMSVMTAQIAGIAALVLAILLAALAKLIPGRRTSGNANKKR